ncbi:MAG: DUF86 domain-containing protein [Chitinispirillales bacterium]|jgi:uncharacterized protein with HEPN domain|nr:DUF86 domain-containing protein [Chitinispirillales bacterium]
MLNNRDKNILERIIKYCDEINQTIAAFDNTLETLKSSVIYKNAVSMCVLQIGELTTHFSKDFLAINTQIPWAGIKKMRNIAAHHYGKFSMEILHGTIIERIPELMEYCQKLLDEG